MKKSINFLGMALAIIFSFIVVSCGGKNNDKEYDTSSFVSSEVQVVSTEDEEEARIEAEEKARIEAEENARIEAEEKARIEAEEKARIEAEEQARIEREKKEWNGASSRSDLRSKINNTVWETTTKDNVTGLNYKFIIKGNSATWYSARPSRNYDDEKDWVNPIDMKLYDIYEPEEGLYVVVFKVSDETDATGAVPYALVFDGKTVTFSRGGQKGPRMKKIG